MAQEPKKFPTRLSVIEVKDYDPETKQGVLVGIKFGGKAHVEVSGTFSDMPSRNSSISVIGDMQKEEKDGKLNFYMKDVNATVNKLENLAGTVTEVKRVRELGEGVTRTDAKFLPDGWKYPIDIHDIPGKVEVNDHKILRGSLERQPYFKDGQQVMNADGSPKTFSHFYVSHEQKLGVYTGPVTKVFDSKKEGNISFLLQCDNKNFKEDIRVFVPANHAPAVGDYAAIDGIVNERVQRDKNGEVALRKDGKPWTNLYISGYECAFAKPDTDEAASLKARGEKKGAEQKDEVQEAPVNEVEEKEFDPRDDSDDDNSPCPGA